MFLKVLKPNWFRILVAGVLATLTFDVFLGATNPFIGISGILGGFLIVLFPHFFFIQTPYPFFNFFIPQVLIFIAWYLIIGILTGLITVFVKRGVRSEIGGTQEVSVDWGKPLNVALSFLFFLSFLGYAYYTSSRVGGGNPFFNVQKFHEAREQETRNLPIQKSSLKDPVFVAFMEYSETKENNSRNYLERDAVVAAIRSESGKNYIFPASLPYNWVFDDVTFAKTSSPSQQILLYHIGERATEKRSLDVNINIVNGVSVYEGYQDLTPPEYKFSLHEVTQETKINNITWQIGKIEGRWNAVGKTNNGLNIQVGISGDSKATLTQLEKLLTSLLEN